MALPFAAFDVDGTIFKSSLAEKVIDECITAGAFRPDPFNDVYISRRRWQVDNNEGLYQSYLHRLVGTFITQIAGVEVEQFNQVTAVMLEKHNVRRFAFPRNLIRALRPSHYLIAISGSPDILVEPFLHDLELHASYGSRLEIVSGKFTGEAISVGDKATVLNDLVEDNIVTQAGSVAIGDTFGDRPMLEYAEAPIMFNSSRTLTNYGSKLGWLRVNEVKDQITALRWDKELGLYIEQNPDEIIHSLRT